MQNYFIFLTSMLLANYLYVGDYLEKICEPSQTSYILVIYYNQNRTHQSWELGRKCDSNFILTFVITKVRYDSITTEKIFVKNLLFLVVYQ